MLITREIEIKISNSNVRRYEELGYDIPKYIDKRKRIVLKSGTKIYVKVKDLANRATDILQLQCDYCNKKFYKKNDNYVKTKKDVVDKDACEECLQNKKQEENLILYGVKTHSQRDVVKTKIKETNNTKYGGSYSKTQECKDKYKKTSLKKYGTEHPMKNLGIQEILKQSMIQKYGVSNSAYNNESIKKRHETNLKRYGHISPFGNIEIRKKARASMYKNETVPTSKQQKYLYDLLGGKINYPINNINLDIAFPEEMIYIEYDGGLHNGEVVFGTLTEEDFKNKERNRWYLLNKLGWKEIRIISLKDKLPEDDKIIEMIKYAKDFIISGRSWIKFDIDNNNIITRFGKTPYDYKKLRKINKSYGR